MRKIEKLNLDYIGYESPESEAEVDIECLGLELLIKCAEQRIALLKQGLRVAQLAQTTASEVKPDPKPEEK